MCSTHRKTSFVGGLLKMKCPNCRKGNMFANSSIFPLNKCLKLVDNCSECGQQMVVEQNNGPGINYALTVIIFLINLAWYWPIFGLSVWDNSIEIYVIVSTIIVLLVQPWSMRYARVIYLYFYVPYKSNRHIKN